MQKSTYIALILLIFGCVFYTVCRQDIIFFSLLGKPNFLEYIRYDIHYQEGNIFLYFLLFCFPDAVWYMALLLLQKQFYNADSVFSKVLFCLSALLPFVLEFMQYFGIIAGTFDVFDLITYLITFLIFLIVWKRKKILKLFSCYKYQ